MLNTNTVKIGFIGYGNMAGATSAGLMLSGAIKPEQIYACANNYDKLCRKAAADGVHPCKTALEVIETCDVIFIGVKPYMVESVMSPLKDALDGKIIVSLAANTYHDVLEEIMPASHHVATAPNTPVSACEGIFICEEENTLAAEEKTFVHELLENLGLVLWMDRDHMGIGGVIAGCTPAFVSMFMEALGDAGCKHGLTRPVVYKLIAQMLAGTGKMALKSGDHPGQMKDAVCSPAGTTIVGVSTLEKNGFRFAVIDAIDQIQNKIHGKA
ncbi:pyrroline-5-carboxylate reductase [Emergencia sp.]|uniref:pyrroline-5-carboxylate reductase n=1 Tax=Emergencia sp. TaxID=1926557 RepID=UPI003AF108F6